MVKSWTTRIVVRRYARPTDDALRQITPVISCPAHRAIVIAASKRDLRCVVTSSRDENLICSGLLSAATVLRATANLQDRLTTLPTIRRLRRIFVRRVSMIVVSHSHHSAYVAKDYTMNDVFASSTGTIFFRHSQI
jgi:hypothetical protein